MTDEYVAGFFDAEGHVGLRSSNRRVSMSQKDPEVLHAIQNFLGYGQKVRCNSQGMWLYVIAKREHREDFIDRVLPHSIVKRTQLTQLRKM
jgi:intein-encoded DNA endonuclease-like protein